MRPIDAETLKNALSENPPVSPHDLLTLFSIINSQPTLGVGGLYAEIYLQEEQISLLYVR